METKDCRTEVKMTSDEEGVIEGYASVFGNVDQGGDIVQRGAFAESLRSGQKVRMLSQHDPDKVIGIWDELREDDRGLYVKGRLLRDIPRARDAAVLVKNGAMDGLSIGFSTKKSSRPSGEGRRVLEEISLWEVSLVTFPMNQQATITNYKNAEGDIDPRKLEAGLRDVFGLSQKQAKAFMADGLKGLRPARDVSGGAMTEGQKVFLDAIRQIGDRHV